MGYFIKPNFTRLTEGMRSKFGLHKKATIKDLPAKVLAELLTVEQLIEMVVIDYFGNHWVALKIKNLEIFRRVNHEQWDLNLSHLAQTRICGLPQNDGSCPYPFEDNITFWVGTRKLKTRC